MLRTLLSVVCNDPNVSIPDPPHADVLSVLALNA